MAGHDGLRYVYLLGSAFSGSTLLTLTLDSLPSVTSVGELTPTDPSQPVDLYPCSCGEPIGHCAFWRDVAAQMGERGWQFDPIHWTDSTFVTGRRALDRATVWSLHSAALDQLRDVVVRHTPVGRRFGRVGRFHLDLSESVLHLTGKSVFVDASKDGRRLALLLRYARPDIHVVHIVRDSPGYVSSAQSNLGIDLPTATRAWTAVAVLAERVRRVVDPAHWSLVSYEKFCSDPGGTLAGLCKDLATTYSPEALRLDSPGHHVRGNRMRLRASQPIELDNSWTSRLTETEIRWIQRETKTWRIRYGYA